MNMMIYVQSMSMINFLDDNKNQSFYQSKILGRISAGAHCETEILNIL